MRRAAAIAGAVALGLALALAVDVLRKGGLQAWLAGRGVVAYPQVPAYEVRGRAVDVDGRAVYLDCRGAGSPTVILEAGFGSDAGGWGGTLDGLAAFTRVCAWDRPGLGRSDPRGPHTGLEAATDLRRALDGAGEAGPYVVMAHSLGGVYALLFASLESAAAREQDDVVGFVMLDTYEPLVWIADDPGLDPATRDGHRKVLADTGAMIAAGEELEWEATLAELRALPPTDIATLLLPTTMSVKFGDQAQPVPSALASAWYRAVEAHYLEGRVEVVTGSGHVVHFDRPDLVLTRIRELVERVRAG